MKRSEVTVEILRDMGWRPTHSNLFNLEKIVFNLQDLDYWKYLRCRVDDSKTYEEKELWYVISKSADVALGQSKRTHRKENRYEKRSNRNFLHSYA